MLPDPQTRMVLPGPVGVRYGFESMSELLHQFVLTSAARTPDATAIGFRGTDMNYHSLAQNIQRAASGFVDLGLGKQERVAVFLPKQFESVISMFAALYAGAIAVPINPLLKCAQSEHILRDSGARILITNAQRLKLLVPNLHNCHDLHTVICVDMLPTAAVENLPAFVHLVNWAELLQRGGSDVRAHRVIDTDIAGLLYTSGSTGKAKGVVLSHRNMVTGAKSVSQYLQNSASDRLLAVLPFSFDYGFSQLSTAFLVGARVVLLDYMLPQEVMRILENEQITGLAAVPTIWQQLVELAWPENAVRSLRYITNSGGVLPRHTLRGLRDKIPNTEIFLMYGFTEAFRATYLPPHEIEQRPDSIGKAIPNAELLVVREDGTPCEPNEQGELVQLGSLVARGYWNDPDKTARCFKPAPVSTAQLTLAEIAAWSGDSVRMDEAGYLYFIGRKDDMIKTSGYRVSPTEVEEVVYATGLVKETAAFGVAHETLGQAIVVAVTAIQPSTDLRERILAECKKNLPGFMLPQDIVIRDSIPVNVNGKFDRMGMAADYQQRAISPLLKILGVAGEQSAK